MPLVLPTSATWQRHRAACRMQQEHDTPILTAGNLRMWSERLGSPAGYGTCSLRWGQQLPGHLFSHKFSHRVWLEALGADKSLGALASVRLLRSQDCPEHGLTVLSSHVCVGTAQLLGGRRSRSKLLGGARKS